MKTARVRPTLVFDGRYYNGRTICPKRREFRRKIGALYRTTDDVGPFARVEFVDRKLLPADHHHHRIPIRNRYPYWNRVNGPK